MRWGPASRNRDKLITTYYFTSSFDLVLSASRACVLRNYSVDAFARGASTCGGVGFSTALKAPRASTTASAGRPACRAVGVCPVSGWALNEPGRRGPELGVYRLGLIQVEVIGRLRTGQTFAERSVHWLFP